MRLLPTRPHQRGPARRRLRRHRAATVARPALESLEGRLLLTGPGRPAGNTGTGFYVVGRNIYDANGNQFVIRGINQTEAWGDPTGNFAALSQFPKTQANAVRVVFGPGIGASSPATARAGRPAAHLRRDRPDRRGRRGGRQVWTSPR